MLTWLHGVDTLRGLARETGAVADWARLQLLLRGEPAAAPRAGDGAFLAPLLASGMPAPPPRDALVLVRHLGVRPGEDWGSTMEGQLAGEQGAAAADLLLLMGALQVAHLQVLVRHHARSPTFGLWLCAVADDPTAMARELEPWLRDDLASGGRALSACGALLLREPPADLKRGEAALIQGSGEARLAVSGSVRRRLREAVLARLDVLPPALAALIHVAATLHKAPRLPDAVLFMVGWRAATARLSMPERVARGEDGPDATRWLTEALRRGEPVPRPPAGGPALIWDLQHGRVPSEGPVPRPSRLVAVLHPEAILAQLRSENPYEALDGAALLPAEEILVALMALPVPADPERREALGWALASMGVTVPVPLLRSLIPLLDERAAARVRRRYAELLGSTL